MPRNRQTAIDWTIGIEELSRRTFPVGSRSVILNDPVRYTRQTSIVVVLHAPKRFHDSECEHSCLKCGSLAIPCKCLGR